MGMVTVAKGWLSGWATPVAEGFSCPYMVLVCGIRFLGRHVTNRPWVPSWKMSVLMSWRWWQAVWALVWESWLIPNVAFSSRTSYALPINWSWLPRPLYSIYSMIYHLKWLIPKRSKINKVTCDLSLLFLISDHTEVILSENLRVSCLNMVTNECKNTLRSRNSTKHVFVECHVAETRQIICLSSAMWQKLNKACVCQLPHGRNSTNVHLPNFVLLLRVFP